VAAFKLTWVAGIGCYANVVRLGSESRPVRGRHWAQTFARLSSGSASAIGSALKLATSHGTHGRAA